MTSQQTFSRLSIAVSTVSTAGVAQLPAGLGRDGHIDEAGAPARAKHTSLTMAQWALYAGSLPLDFADLALTYEVLGAGWSGCAGADRSRRFTCGQLARECASLAHGEYHGTARAQAQALRRAISVWVAVAEGFLSLAKLGDSRAAVSQQTCEKEACRLADEAASLESLLPPGDIVD